MKLDKGPLLCYNTNRKKRKRCAIILRFIVTYYDANKEKKIHFFKTLVEARVFVNNMRALGSGMYKDFEIKIVKPY